MSKRAIKSIVDLVDTKKHEQRKILKNDPRFPANILRGVFAGASGSGKSNAICSMILKGQLNAHRYLIVAPTIKQPVYRVLEDYFTKIDEEKEKAVMREVEKYNRTHKVKIHPDDVQEYLKPTAIFEFELPQNWLETIEGKESFLVVLDDCLCMPRERMKELTNLFIRGRHKAISLIFASQAYFLCPRPMRLQCNWVVIFNGAADREIQMMRQELGGGVDKDTYLRGIRDGISQPYSFVSINLNKPKPEERFLRCDMSTSVFGSGGPIGAPSDSESEGSDG